ncbi:MAG: hypothetical protein PHI12_07715 [Dehalococcoidales bacterium]|nr:hypothetical protein [Dehalococcoidales bacterium]
MDATLKGLFLREGGKLVSQGLKFLVSRSTSRKTELTETTTETGSLIGPPSVTAAVQPQIIKPALPTSDETTVALKRRLAKELYKAELDLTSGMKIAGKPCDCLDHKHGLYLEAASEELVAQDPGNPVYQEIIDWLKVNHSKLTIEAIASGKYAGEYPVMANQFKQFRKIIMDSAADPQAVTLTLEDAKKLAAEEAVREVEKAWKSASNK